MSKSNNRLSSKKNPFTNRPSRKGGILEFKYTSSNENLVTGESFEYAVNRKFHNLPLFKIIFPCISYLIVGGKILFSHDEHESWVARVGELKVEDDAVFEKTDSMDEDYELIFSEQDFSEPFQVLNVGKYKFTGDGGFDMFVFLSFNKRDGGFLIPVQCKYRSSENIQLYDPNIVYTEGYKTLNHYIKDFDNLLSNMIPNNCETNYPVRYGLFIVNDRVNIPEKYPRTKNLILIIHESEITVDTIRSFFNRIHTSNQRVSQIHKQETFCSPRETIVNQTDKAIIAAQTDIVSDVLHNIDDETWSKDKDKIIAMMLDTVKEVNTCLLVSNQDRSNPRYKTELDNHRDRYSTKVRNSNNNDNHMIETNEQNNTFDMTDLHESLTREFDILEVVKSLSK